MFHHFNIQEEIKYNMGKSLETCIRLQGQVLQAKHKGLLELITAFKKKHIQELNNIMDLLTKLCEMEKITEGDYISSCNILKSINKDFDTICSIQQDQEDEEEEEEEEETVAVIVRRITIDGIGYFLGAGENNFNIIYDRDTYDEIGMWVDNRIIRN
jgi:hypothetical protein